MTGPAFGDASSGMVSPPRAVTHALFERQIMFAAEQHQRADRRIVIRTPQDRVHGDPQAALERDWVGRCRVI